MPADKRTPFERIALVLQGGGALGAYQGGVYQAMAEADLHPDWVAGISIGAINSALIASNPPEKRIERLRDFWEAVSTSPVGVPYLRWFEPSSQLLHQLMNQAGATNIALFGAPHFFTPRFPPSTLWPAGSVDKASYYDTTPLKGTLERLVDFDRINAGHLRFCVGAVNVATGNFAYFDNTTNRIRAEHIIASGSCLPVLPQPKSTASIIGMAASSPTHPCSGCSIRNRGRIRLPSRSISGARAGTCRATSPRSRSATRRSSIRAAAARQPIITSMRNSFALQWQTSCGACPRSSRTMRKRACWSAKPTTRSATSST